MTLISPVDLAARLDDPSLRIVDLRWYLGRPGDGRRAFDASHLPGAIHLDLDTDLSGTAADGPGRHPLPSPAAFAERMAAAGIGDGTLVVGYDDVGGWVAARLWWMLEHAGHAGHADAAVLDGGIGAWTAAGYPLETGAAVASPAGAGGAAPATFTLRGPAAEGRWPGTIGRDELRGRLGELLLLDARAGARYRGETEPVDPVAGHIPTAVNAPVDGNLDAAGRFLPPAELHRRFVTLGADGARQIVTSCGSGTSACHHALAMRVAGLADPTLYVGSWSDWSTAGYPVATGPEPGDPA